MSSPDMDHAGLVQTVATFLDTVRTAALATRDADGAPGVCNVQVVHLGELQLLWASKPTTTHSANLAREPRVALALYGHDDVEPSHIHGAQLRGSARPVELTEELWSPYVRRFPMAARMRKAFEAGEQRLYRFQPTWVRWIDNRRRFGFKVESDLPR